MKTLLTLINHPAESQDFMSYAANMAKDLNFNLYLLYTQDPEAYSLGTTGASGMGAMQVQSNMEAMMKTANEELEKNIIDLKEKIENEIKVDYSAEIGNRKTLIDKFISEGKAEMVVLERQEEETFWNLTSTNMDVVRLLDCPVWVIPRDAIYKPYREIIYSTDYNEADISGINKLIRIMQKYHPFITSLHVTESADFKEDVMRSGFNDLLKEKTNYDRLAVKTLSKEEDGDLADRLNDFSVDHNADLIVVTRENKGFFDRLFKKSKTREIIKETELPVLVFQE